MRKMIKVLVVIGIAAVVLSKCGVNNMKKADFVKHGEIKTYNIGIDEIELDKDACEEEAKALLVSKSIEGMSEDAMAKEIYAHIFIHDMIESLPDFVQNNKIVARAYGSTVNGIDLEDFGDTFVRQIAYEAIWVIGGLFA